MFLRRPTPAKIEVINDLNRDVVTFFRVLQRHERPFLEMLRWQLASRSEFDRLNRQDPDTLTDLERAARFFFVQRMSMAALVGKRHYRVSRSAASYFNLPRLLATLEEVHQRLARVVIECLPFDAFIRRYDRPGALFYCDPPYWGCEQYYGRALFPRGSFERLAEVLRGIAGRFIVSINDVPPIREIFAGLETRQVPIRYTAGQARHKEVDELLISGP